MKRMEAVKLKGNYDYRNLREKMREERHSMRSLAKLSGISLSALSGKLNNKSDFLTTEMLNISKILGLEAIEPYFFIQKVSNTKPKNSA